MTMLFIVKVTPQDQMDFPIQSYGPISGIIPVTWRGYNDNEFTPPPVNEIVWPTSCKYRDPSWCIVGVRPPRPMPRALLYRIEDGDSSTGTIPNGIVNTEFFGKDESVGTIDRQSAVYVGGSVDSDYSATMLLQSPEDSHVTNANPILFTADDFVQLCSVLFIGPTGDRWQLIDAPDNWSRVEPIPVSIPDALSVAEFVVTSGPPTRQIRLFNEPDDPSECPSQPVTPYVSTWPHQSGIEFQVDPFASMRTKWRWQDPVIGPPNGSTTISHVWFGEGTDFLIRVRAEQFTPAVTPRVKFRVTVFSEGESATTETALQPYPVALDTFSTNVGSQVRTVLQIGGAMVGEALEISGKLTRCNHQIILESSDYPATPHCPEVEVVNTLGAPSANKTREMEKWV